MQWSFIIFGFMFLMSACGKTSRDPAPPVPGEQPSTLSIITDFNLDQNSIVAGDQLQLQALAQYDNGETAVIAAVWSVVPAELASIDSNGLMQAIAEGEVTVTAQHSGLSGTLKLLVEAVPTLSDRYQIIAASSFLEVGQSLSLQFMDEEQLIQVEPQWKTLNPNIATVNNTGVVEGLAPGEVAIVANYQGQDYSISLEVRDLIPVAPVVTDLIFIFNDKLLVAGDQEVQTFDSYIVKTIAKYSYGEDSEVEAAWASSEPTLASVEAGKIQAAKAGTVTLTASFQDFQKVLVLNIVDHPSQKLSISLASATVEEGSTLTFTTMYQTPDGLLSTVEADCQISPNELAQFTEDQSKSILAIKAGTVEVICQYLHLTAQVEFVIIVKPVLVGLRIVELGPLELGTSYQMIAIGQFDPGAVEKEVQVTWTLIDDQISLTLYENGVVIGRQPGAAVLMAELDGITASIDLVFDYKEIKIQETQFWVYQVDEEDNLTFNFPWDEEEGDGIIRETEAVANFALSCATRANELLRETLNQDGYRQTINRATANGTTADVVVLVNVIDGPEFHQALRMMDRDAYFWHWNDNDKKPVLSMSNFKKGLWVWEVIAIAPGSCIQPSQTEMMRYLDYVNSRLAIAK